jgi:rhodanese-related sulfurtransferase
MEVPVPGVKDMLAAANAVVPRLDPARVREMASRGDVLILDVRAATELAASGKVKGAVHVPRGLLEFKADPESPSRHPALQPDRTILVYCGSGGRAALSGKTLKELGYGSVYNAGGFKELAEAGLEVEREG